jgi:GntR family transcriptional regulator/MocR family aminotransferase
VGFVVAPPGLAEGFAKVRRHTGQLVPAVIQLALADFIERGHHRAHVRRMKAVYAARMAAFVDGIAAQSGGALTAALPDGGLQTVVTSQQAMSDEALAALLAKAGIQSQPLCDFAMLPGTVLQGRILAGIAAWSETAAAEALSRLQNVFDRRSGR